MGRVLIVVVTLLLFAGWAEGGGTLSTERETWLLAYYDGGKATKAIIEAWSAGVAETLTFVAIKQGCPDPSTVAGTTLAAATGDLLRQNTTWAPMAGAVRAYGRLSGCGDLLFGR